MTIKNQKQQLLIEYLLSSPDTFALCKSIVKAEYFDPEFRKTVAFIHEYYDQYSAVPNPDQISAETSVEFKTRQVTKDQIAYCSDQIEKFCKRKAFEHAIMAAPALINEENFGEAMRQMQDAISVSLNKNMGIDYFNNPRERLDRLLLSAPRTPTKWHQFDDLLGGGLARTEMILFSANSGGGKSITLANLAINFLAQKLNVLYLSLELSEDLIGQRFDTMFSGVPSVIWRQNHNTIAATLELVSDSMGKLTIKHMNAGTTANQIRSYLKEFELKHQYVPDLLVVDYLDRMGTNERVSADNISEKDKLASEQLYDIGGDYQMFIATASQQNRSAVTAAEPNQSHIAGGLTKVSVVDWYASVIFTPAMKAAGEIGFSFLKTRSSDGVGKTIYLKWDKDSLRIMNPLKDETIDDDGVITSRVAQAKTNKSPKKSLEDLLKL